MKKIIPVLAALSALFISCAEEDKPKVTVDPTSAAVESTGGTATLVVTSNAPWTATCDYEEVSINPSSGDGGASVVVTVPKSTYKDTKAIRVTFKAKRDSSYTSTAKFVITLPAMPFIELSSTSGYVSPDGGGVRFSLSANEAWSAVDDKAVEGLEIKPAEGAGNADVTVSLPVNGTGSARTANVTFALKGNPDVKTVFSVSQNPK